MPRDCGFYCHFNINNVVGDAHTAFMERLTMLESNHLRSFVAVAEKLHFGRAAALLNISQPPVSRHIQLLEQRLDCELFDRNRRSVTLTSAGAVFLPEARQILALMEQAATVARKVATGLAGHARCGFTATVGYKLLPVLLRRLKLEMPEVKLSLRELVSLDQIAAIEARELDLAITRAPVSFSALESRLIWREPLFVALPKGNPLLRHKTISWRDLHNLDMIMHDPKKGAYFHNLIMGRLALEGIFPNFVQYLSQIHSILSLVNAGSGIAVVPSSASVLCFPEIEFRQFDEPRMTTSELFVAWRGDNLNPVVPMVADLAVNCGLQAAVDLQKPA